MENEKLALVSEFEQWSQAEGAGRALKKRGFDMGNVKVVGADWLDAIDPGGSKSPKESAVMGMRIAIPLCTSLGLLVGLIHALGAAEGNRLTLLLVPILEMAALGTTLGALIGALFGFLGHDSYTPSWAEPEYGRSLRQGSYLLLVQGDSSLIDRARQVVVSASPVSIRVRPAKG